MDLTEDFTLPHSVEPTIWVIGIGASGEAAVESLKKLYPEGVKFGTADGVSAPFDGGNIPMAVVIADENDELAQATALKFRKINVLALGIFTKDAHFLTAPATFNGRALTPEPVATAKALIDCLMSKAVICFDYRDLYNTLDNTRFAVTDIVGDSAPDVAERIKASLATVGDDIYDRVTLIIYRPTDPDAKFTMSDMGNFVKITEMLNKQTHVRFAVLYDASLAAGQVRATLLEADSL